jgi:hypothetical protein
MLRKMLFVIFCLMIAATGSSYAYIESIAAAWTFDADQGDTIVDASGNGNNGVLAGNAPHVAGVFGDALEFDAATTYIEVPFSESLRLLNESSFTLAAWFIANEIPSTNRVVLQQLDANGTGRTWLYVTSDTGGEIASYIGGGRTSSGVFIEPGVWYHAAVVVTEGGDTDSVQIYVNGSPEGDPLAIGMESCEGAFHIGAHKTPTSNVWDGLLDEVVLFNKALSQAEIESLMTNGISGGAAVEPQSKLAVTWGKIKI